MICRRSFVKASFGGLAAVTCFEELALAITAPQVKSVSLSPPQTGEDVFAYVQRKRGAFEPNLYRQILGAANEFKEGDLLQTYEIFYEAQEL